jgi:hypothetical protein
VSEVPYKAWRITPSFFIEEVTLVSSTRYGSHVSDKGKWYAPLSDLFDTKDAAKHTALRRLEERREKAQKTLDAVPRLLANLEK